MIPLEKLLSELVNLHDRFDDKWKENRLYIAALEEALARGVNHPDIHNALKKLYKENDEIRKKLLAISDKVRSAMRKNPRVMTTGSRFHDATLTSCTGVIPLKIVGQALTYIAERSAPELASATN
jgi:transposase